MFEKTMDFSEALKNLKAGKKLTRKGWNGNIVSFDPNMYIWLEPSCKIPRMDAMSENLKSAFGRNASMEKLGTFIMKTRDNKLMVGWLATNTDLLAEDWVVVE
jgi:hypothetical protein